MDKRDYWYRKQCALYAVRLGEWLDDRPSRMTKTRKVVMAAETELARNFKNDKEAYEALIAVEEMAWNAPTAAFKVIHKAIRPSESFNKWLQDTHKIDE